MEVAGVSPDFWNATSAMVTVNGISRRKDARIVNPIDLSTFSNASLTGNRLTGGIAQPGLLAERHTFIVKTATGSLLDGEIEAFHSVTWLTIRCQVAKT